MDVKRIILNPMEVNLVIRLWFGEFLKAYVKSYVKKKTFLFSGFIKLKFDEKMKFFIIIIYVAVNLCVKRIKELI